MTRILLSLAVTLGLCLGTGATALAARRHLGGAHRPQGARSRRPDRAPQPYPTAAGTEGGFAAGSRFNSTESRVIVGAAIGALGAGGAVACNRNPLCLVLVGAGIGAVLAYWNAVANQGRCLFSSSFPTSYVTTVRC